MPETDRPRTQPPEVECSVVRASAAEYALGILPPEERPQVYRHVANCPDCRLEVDGMRAVGERLLDLVPGTEPPVGFDRRAVSRIAPPSSPLRKRGAGARRRSRLASGAAGLAAAAAVALLAWISAGSGSSPHHPGRTVLASATLTEAGRPVGSVRLYAGEPPWLGVTLQSPEESERVTCETVGPNGLVTELGSFDLYDGKGSWSVPDPRAGAGVSAVRLVDSQGRVLASATLG